VKKMKNIRTPRRGVFFLTHTVDVYSTLQMLHHKMCVWWNTTAVVTSSNTWKYTTVATKFQANIYRLATV